MIFHPQGHVEHASHPHAYVCLRDSHSSPRTGNFPLLGSVPNFDSILGESLPTLQHKIIPGSGSITPVTTSAPRNCGMIRTGGESSITDHSYL